MQGVHLTCAGSDFFMLDHFESPCFGVALEGRGRAAFMEALVDELLWRQAIVVDLAIAFRLQDFAEDHGTRDRIDAKLPAVRLPLDQGLAINRQAALSGSDRII